MQPLSAAQLHALGGEGVVLALFQLGSVNFVSLKRQQVQVSGTLAGVAQEGFPLAAGSAGRFMCLQNGGFFARNLGPGPQIQQIGVALDGE